MIIRVFIIFGILFLYRAIILAITAYEGCLTKADFTLFRFSCPFIRIKHI